MIQIPIGEVVFLHRIGYAVLVKCPNSQSITCFDPSSVTKDDPSDAIQTLFETPCNTPATKQQNILLSLNPTDYQIYVPQSLVRNSITLRIKVFFDKRQTVKIRIQVNATVQDLKRKVFESLGKNVATFYQTKLFYPLVELQELQDSLLIWECRLPENAKLVLLTHQTFSLAIPKQHPLKLKNLTIQKLGNQTYTTLLSNVGWAESGKHYWEVKIDKFQNEDDVFIGVAYKNIDITSCPTHSKFWGIIPLYAKRFSPLDVGNLINYGSVVKAGDTIGMLVQFANKKANLTFYRNGISFGIAYQGISGVLYPAITLFGSSNNVVEISYDPQASMPFIN